MSPTVLVVDDEANSRDIYRTILTHCGYAVIEAENGEEAIRRAHEDHPDLILMDVSIPLIDGWQATRTLKADPATAGIPVLALTAYALPSAREISTEAGCDGYIAKPVEPMRVVEEVRRLIGS